MKKFIVTLLVALLALTGCSASSKTYKVGTAVITSLSTKDYKAATADKDEALGQVQANTYYAIVLLEGDKVVKVSIDTAQNTVKYDGKGELKNFDKAAATPTKKEKEDKYGMKGSSKIGKEWFEQIAELEKYMEGKTIADIKATPTTKKDDAHTAVPTGDLATTVSITIQDYLAVVEKAAANAVEVKDVKNVGLASVTSIKANSATADKDGDVQFNTTLAGTAVDKDGKLLYTYIDTAQNSIKLDTASKATITSKDATGFSSKKELKEAYDMKGASKIGKEWYEQIASLEAALVGKKADEVKAIADKDGKVSGDLASSVSITVSAYVEAVTKSQSTGYTKAAE